MHGLGTNQLQALLATKKLRSSRKRIKQAIYDLTETSLTGHCTLHPFMR